MKRLQPWKRIGSGGSIRTWAALVTAIGIGCLQISFALASSHGGGGHVGGGHALGGGNSHFSAGHVNSRFTGSSHFTGASNVQIHSRNSQVRNYSSNLGGHFNSDSRASFYSKSASSRTATRYRTALNQHRNQVAVNHHDSVNRSTSASRNLARANAAKAAINHDSSVTRFMSVSRNVAGRTRVTLGIRLIPSSRDRTSPTITR